jgi:hypothetical protein
MIKTSLRLFVCGWFALLPVIGLFPAIYVVISSVRNHSRFRNEWNPAANYLSWGVGLALFGLGLSILLGLVLLQGYLMRDFPGTTGNPTHPVFND